MKETIQLINDMRKRLGWDKTDDLFSLIGFLNEEVQALTDEVMADSIDYEKVEAEVADVLMVLLALIDDLNLDGKEIVKKKMQEVIIKYEAS